MLGIERRLGELEASSASQSTHVQAIAKEIIVLERTTTISEVQQSKAFDRDLGGTTPA